MTAFDKYEHKATKTRPKFPFHEEEWKMPGWTGHKTDVGEVYGGTPFYQQLNTKAPIETSTLCAPKVHKEVNNATIFKDPANNSANWLREKPDNLFPSQVTKPAKPGNPPFISASFLATTATRAPSPALRDTRPRTWRCATALRRGRKERLRWRRRAASRASAR